MQRCCGKLRPSFIYAFRSFAAASSSPSHMSLHSPPPAFLVNTSNSTRIFSFPYVAGRHTRFLELGFCRPVPVFPSSVNQLRGFASIKKERRRTPMSPGTSKLKKYKIKCYSSCKSRFRTMNDGQLRRWRAGKRHNAHLKSKKSKRRLRQPEIVHPAYAKVFALIEEFGSSKPSAFLQPKRAHHQKIGCLLTPQQP